MDYIVGINYRVYEEGYEEFRLELTCVGITLATLGNWWVGSCGPKPQILNPKRHYGNCGPFWSLV